MMVKIWLGAAATLFLILFQVGADDGLITKIEAKSGDAVLTISTTANEDYKVQCNTNLINSLWTDIPSTYFTATDGVSTQSVSAAASSCYFRVMKPGEIPTEGPTSPQPPPPPPPPTRS